MKSVSSEEFIKLVICHRNISNNDPDNDNNDDIASFNMGKVEAFNFILGLWEMVYED